MDYPDIPYDRYPRRLLSYYRGKCYGKSNSVSFYYNLKFMRSSIMFLRNVVRNPCSRHCRTSPICGSPRFVFAFTKKKL